MAAAVAHAPSQAASGSQPTHVKTAAPSAYDNIRAEWRKRADENSAKIERISNLQKSQFEDMQTMAAKVGAIFEEKLANICRDMMSAMTEEQEQANLAQVANQTAFASLAASIASLGAQIARMETEGKRGAQDDAAGVRSRQRTSIITDEMSGSIADAA